MNTTSATMNRAPSRSGIAWKVTLILIPLITLGMLLWLRNRRGVSAASADSFLLRHGSHFSAYESKRTAVWVRTVGR